MGSNLTLEHEMYSMVHMYLFNWALNTLVCTLVTPISSFNSTKTPFSVCLYVYITFFLDFCGNRFELEIGELPFLNIRSDPVYVFVNFIECKFMAFYKLKQHN